MLSSSSSARAAALLFFGAVLLHCSLLAEAVPDRQLLSSKAAAIQNGSDISLVGAGLLEVILQNNELVFEVCHQCVGDFLACFEGDGNPGAAIDECKSKCGLSINANEQKIKFMGEDAQSGKRKTAGCALVTMVKGLTSIVRKDSGAEFDTAETCLPKLDGGKMKLIVKTVDKCPVKIKNAYIAPPPPPTATMTPSNTGTTAAAPGDFALKYGWVILLASLLFLVLVVGGVILTVSCCAKRKAKKASLPKHVKANPNDAPQMIKVVPNAAAPQIAKAMPNAAAPDLPSNVRVKPRTKKAKGERRGAPLYDIKKEDEERLFPNGMK